MSVSRTINIRLLTNQRFSDLIKRFVGERWIFGLDGNIQSQAEDDIDDFNYISYNDFKEVKRILDKRESKGIFNNIHLWDTKTQESLSILNWVNAEPYHGYSKHYDFMISFDGLKRIQGAERYTDYGFYLNELIPRIQDMGCYICEIKCHDFDC